MNKAKKLGIAGLLIGLSGFIFACRVSLEHARPVSVSAARRSRAHMAEETGAWATPLITHTTGVGYCADVEANGPAGTRVRIHELKYGEVVWERKAEDAQMLNDVRWTKDGKRLAFIEDCGDRWRVVIWNMDGKCKVHYSPEMERLGDSSHNIVWSPDNSRFLVRSFVSGGLDADAGTLNCFDLKSGRVREVARSVRLAEWADKNTVCYWVIDGNGEWVQDTRSGENPRRRVPAVIKRPQFKTLPPHGNGL